MSQDAAKKKLFKEVAEALMFVSGTSEITSEMGEYIIDRSSSYSSSDAFANDAVSTDEALLLQRALAFGGSETDPTVTIENILEHTNKSLPDLAGMQVQRGFSKAGGMGAKTCSLSAFTPHLRDMAKRITAPNFLKEVFKAFKGKPPAAAKKAAPGASSPSSSPTKKTFGSKKEAAGGDTGSETSSTTGGTTKKVFGKKKSADDDSASNTAASTPSPTPAPEDKSGENGEVVATTKKTFFKKRSTTPDSSTTASVNATPPASTNNETSDSAVSTKKTFTKTRSDTPTNTEGETSVTATRKTFGKKATPENSIVVSAPPNDNNHSTNEGEASSGTATKKTFFKKSASSSNVDDHNAHSPTSPPPPPPPPANNDDSSTSSGGATKKVFVKKRTPTQSETSDSHSSSSYPVNANVSPSSHHQQQHHHQQPFHGSVNNTLSNYPNTISETSSTGVVITPRCPECAIRKLVIKQDVACQTDWGARFVTAREASLNTPEGRATAAIRNDISSAVEEAQSKANELLAMRKKFVEARMKSICDAEEAILRSLPPQDQVRLSQLYDSPSSAALMDSLPASGGVDDPLRVARSNMYSAAAHHNQPQLLPDDNDAFARLRESANNRLRELSQEENQIKYQLEQMERGRHDEIAAAARARSMLLSNANNSGSKSPPSQNNTMTMNAYQQNPVAAWGSTPNSATASLRASPGSTGSGSRTRVKRW